MKAKLFIHSVALDLNPTKEVQEFYDSLKTIDKNFVKAGKTEVDKEGNTYTFLVPRKSKNH